MNQLEAPAQGSREHLLPTAAESTTNLPPPAPPSMVLAKGAKRLDSPEVDHEDDEQARQEQNSERLVHDGGNQRGLIDISDDVCDLMVNYDGFKSVGKPFAMAALPRFKLTDDGDEDVMNVRSPILCKPSSSNARSASLSPTCVSALARDDVVKSDDDPNEPSWTIQEFQEYLGMLELLQDVCSNAEGGEMCLSADSLGQMERLLTSLLPQGV